MDKLNTNKKVEMLFQIYRVFNNKFDKELAIKFNYDYSNLDSIFGKIVFNKTDLLFLNKVWKSYSTIKGNMFNKDNLLYGLSEGYIQTAIISLGILKDISLKKK